MRVDRMIPHMLLESARVPSVIVVGTLNEMRAHFAPVTDLETRVWVRGDVTFLRVSLPGSVVE